MNRFAALIGLLMTSLLPLSASEFTVLVYNVENLFDLDRVAEYSDYAQPPEGDYGPGPLLVKLENIRRTLAAVNDGRGPEVVLFQELELDRTPFDTPAAGDFLARTRGRALEDLVREEPDYLDLPSELLLLKYLDDHGMGGYRVAQPDPFRMEQHPVQKNVVFSRYPVRYIRQRPMYRARDLLVVGLDVEGHELVLLDNHWKSGASDPDTEAIRIQNALVVRAELTAILNENPAADVIVGGDFNSYYNQKAAFGDRLALTGINDILLSGNDEQAMVAGEGYRLYNLWNELPWEERGSEVYRGSWGTLMQILLTPGLYDRKGIQYVDNSFGRLVLSGPQGNVDRRWGVPVSWTHFGGGRGFSDHLPVYARFRVLSGEGEEGWMEISPSEIEPRDPAYRPRVDFARINRMAAPAATVLEGMSDSELAQHLGELFQIRLPLAGNRPPMVRIGEREMQVYSPIRGLREKLGDIEPGSLIRAFGQLDVYRGNPQFVIQDPSWLQQP